MSKLIQKAIDVSRGKTPRKKVRAREAAAEEERVKNIPLMPDEDALKRARRRKAASRKGGRASTVLTGDEDKLGG